MRQNFSLLSKQGRANAKECRLHPGPLRSMRKWVHQWLSNWQWLCVAIIEDTMNDLIERCSTPNKGE